jgi:hypothetical protein
VAVAITLFGADSPAALATVVGVLVEVPVMLSVCRVCNQTRGWFGRDELRVGPACREERFNHDRAKTPECN